MLQRCMWRSWDYIKMKRILLKGVLGIRWGYRGFREFGVYGALRCRDVATSG